MRKIIFGIVLSSFCLSNAQQTPSNRGVEFNSTTRSVFMGPAASSKKNLSEESIVGTKYYHESFKTGSIYVKNELFGKYNVRYNGYNDEMEVLQNGKAFALQYEDDVIVTLPRYTYKILRDNTNKRSYFIDFHHGENTALVLRAKIVIKKPVEPKNGFGGKMPATFDKDYSYFIKNLAGTLIPVKLKKKELLKVFGNKSSEIQKFASTNKLNFKKEVDVVKIIDYYNTL